MIVTLEIYMPFYGRFDHLREAVASVLAQSDPEWRLTVVDDVYPDLAPGEWVQSIDDPRVRYVRNTVNLRPSRNYNACVAMSTAKHIVLMGCDDIMLPGYVARARQLLSAYPDADMIQPGVAVIDESGRPSNPLPDRVKRLLSPPAGVLHGERLATSLLRGNWTYFPSLVWRRDHLERKFRVDLDVVQDLAMIMSIVQRDGRLIVDDEVVFHYRRHSASVSAVTGPDGSKFRQESTLFAELTASLRGMGWSRAARAASAHVTSRLNALREVPRAVRARDRAAAISLLRHVCVRTRPQRVSG